MILLFAPCVANGGLLARVVAGGSKRYIEDVFENHQFASPSYLFQVVHCDIFDIFEQKTSLIARIDMLCLSSIVAALLLGATSVLCAPGSYHSCECT